MSLDRNSEEIKAAKKAILDQKLLSYLPLEGWGYRTIDEITEGENNEAVR
jgi:hypothetical protein